MKYEIVAFTDPGRVRQNNEDAVAFHEATGVAVLADGMGGYNAGEIASGMSTAFVHSEMSRWLKETDGRASAQEIVRAMEICVGNANASVYHAAHGDAQYHGMGTTLVVGVFQAGALVLGHIGDSRAYMLRAGAIAQITKDHSFLQEQIDAGVLTVEQAANAPNKNLVTRALGVEAQVETEIHVHEVYEGDVFVFCSDGLSDMITDEQIAWILRKEELSLQDRAHALIGAANMAGGKDNVSVVIVRASENCTKSNLLSQLKHKMFKE